MFFYLVDDICFKLKATGLTMATRTGKEIDFLMILWDKWACKKSSEKRKHPPELDLLHHDRWRKIAKQCGRLEKEQYLACQFLEHKTLELVPVVLMRALTTLHLEFSSFVSTSLCLILYLEQHEWNLLQQNYNYEGFCHAMHSHVVELIQVIAAGDLCAICQEKMHAPILLHCKHIFCEDCVSEW